MIIPMACLWISRNLMGLDDPFSDNISANVIGLALGNAARFVLTRQFVFGVRDEAEALDSVVDPSGCTMWRCDLGAHARPQCSRASCSPVPSPAAGSPAATTAATS